MRTRKTIHNTASRNNLFVLIAVVVVMAAVIAAPVFSLKSSASNMKSAGSAPGASRNLPATAKSRWVSGANTTVPLPPSLTITTYQTDCTTASSDFSLGDTVCAKITGAAQPANGRASTRIAWVSPYGVLAQGSDITSDPQTDTYIIPASAFTTITDPIT